MSLLPVCHKTTLSMKMASGKPGAVHVFDMTRENVGKHIAFGHGVHKCLGSRVAQMQLRVAYEQLFARFPNIEFTGHIKYGPNALVHAISELKVNLYGRGNSEPTKIQVNTPVAAG